MIDKDKLKNFDKLPSDVKTDATWFDKYGDKTVKKHFAKNQRTTG